MADVAAVLRSMQGAHHVLWTADKHADRVLVTADLVDDAVDGAVRHVNRRGIGPENAVLVRLDTIGQPSAERPWPASSGPTR